MIERCFKYRNTIRFIGMFSLSSMLYYLGFGMWVFLMDIPELVRMIKELRRVDE